MNFWRAEDGKSMIIGFIFLLQFINKERKSTKSSIMWLYNITDANAYISIHVVRPKIYDMKTYINILHAWKKMSSSLNALIFEIKAIK